MNDFIKNFYLLCEGDNEIEDLMFSTDAVIKTILEKLVLRKRNIEKRLIEEDNDSERDRTRLRGEIDGINNAISCINISK